MKVQEIQQAKYKERGDHQFLVVSVKKHKTASSGRGTVVAKDGDITIVQNYQKLIRSRITSDPDGYFLVNTQGTKIHNLNQLLQRVAALGQGKFLTATQARKVGATEHTRGECSYTEAAGLSKHMGHSLATSSKYYQVNVTPDEHIDTFERIATLGKRKKRDASPPPPPKRLAWSENQTKLIKDYFKVAIASGTAVTLSEARDFLRVNNIPGRTPKAVQDKVKTIRRQKR